MRTATPIAHPRYRRAWSIQWPDVEERGSVLIDYSGVVVRIPSTMLDEETVIYLMECRESGDEVPSEQVRFFVNGANLYRVGHVLGLCAEMPENQIASSARIFPPELIDASDGALIRASHFFGGIVAIARAAIAACIVEEHQEKLLLAEPSQAAQILAEAARTQGIHISGGPA